jgi:hypothetical protein
MTVLLPITVVLSLSTFLEPNAIGVLEPIVSLSDRNLTLTTPFYVNNTGFYDLSGFNLTVVIEEGNQSLSSSTTSVTRIPAGTNISLSLEEICSKRRILLTNDTNLIMNLHASFRIADTIGLEVSTSSTVPWGAPLYNLTANRMNYDFFNQEFSISISFENHAYFPISGPLLLEIFNSRGESICSINKDIDVLSKAPPFQEHFDSTIDPVNVTKTGFLRLYFKDMEVLEEEWKLE